MDEKQDGGDLWPWITAWSRAASQHEMLNSVYDIRAKCTLLFFNGLNYYCQISSCGCWALPSACPSCFSFQWVYIWLLEIMFRSFFKSLWLLCVCFSFNRFSFLDHVWKPLLSFNLSTFAEIKSSASRYSRYKLSDRWNVTRCRSWSGISENLFCNT